MLQSDQPTQLGDAPYRKWPHRMALLLTCATFPLIWVGGLVTTYDAGMAVPDWPATYGYNLFLYPWQSWIAGPFDLFIEHGHRLLGSLVGLLTIAYLATNWRGATTAARLGTAGLLALVIFQGILGGQRVLLDDRRIAQLHGCVGPIFFALCAVTAVMQSKKWRRWHQETRPEQRGQVHLLGASLILLVLALSQLALGSQLRHGIEYAPASVFRASVVFHIAAALLLGLQSIWFAIRTFRTGTLARALRPTATVLSLALAMQIGLGVTTWIAKYGWPAIFGAESGFVVQAKGLFQSLVTTAHVATGSLILAASFVAVAWSWRLASAAAVAVDSSVDKMQMETRVPRGTEFESLEKVGSLVV